MAKERGKGQEMFIPVPVGPVRAVQLNGRKFYLGMKQGQRGMIR